MAEAIEGRVLLSGAGEARLAPRPADDTRPPPVPAIAMSAAAVRPTLAGLTLVSASSGADLGPLANGQTIELARTGRRLSVRANPAAGVKSVAFKLDGATVRTESFAPYALAGDNGTDYLPWTPTVGKHTLTVTPFGGAAGTGTAGAPVVVRFDVVGATPAAAGTSALWGVGGELWSPSGRLPDFSFAGYGQGESSPPDMPVVANVKRDFGAKGDGVADDTAAILAAIRATTSGAVYLPQGRYKVTRALRINKSNVVLRGDGPGKTIIYAPKPLKEVETGTDWFFKGGFVWVEGRDTGGKLADVSAPAVRGGRTLTVSSTAGIAVGQTIRLVQTDDAKRTLGRHLHAGQHAAGPELYTQVSDRLVDWTARVVAIDGKRLTLDRPLRVDVRLAWKPQVWAHRPTVKNVGVEGIGFQFAGTRYAGHHLEPGFNAVYMKQVTNCWVRDVWTTDADIAVNFGWMVRNSTVEGVRMMHKRRDPTLFADGRTGHHGLRAAGLSQDNLFRRFRFDTRFVHDLTHDKLTNGNVFASGSGLAINFDHHRGAPYENLYTDIDVGDPGRLWASSGNEPMGPYAGARETFWNIRAAGNANLPAPPAGHFPQVNLVGFKGLPPSQSPTGTWAEATAGTGVSPANLYEAQRARRLGGLGAGS